MSRGHDRERLIRDLLESGGGPYAGPWWVSRAAGSLGDADLVALAGRFGRPHVSRPCRALLVEVKSTARSPFAGFPPADRRELIAAAELAGAEAWLCWTPPTKIRGKASGIHGCWIHASSGPRMTTLRPCVERDCPNLTHATRCPSCARSYRRRRKTEGRTGQRGSTTAWRKLRAKVLLHHDHRCAECGVQAGQLEVDHVDGDATNDSLLNLQALCMDCHRPKTAQHVLRHFGGRRRDDRSRRGD